MKRDLVNNNSNMIILIIGVCTLPLATAFAPVVNDALTSNETLAAARNAFLIRHLFDELANNNNKVGEDEKGRDDLYGELAREGQLPNRTNNSSTTMKMTTTTSWSSTSTTRRTTMKEEEEDNSEPKQEVMAPIRPINRQQQQQRDQQAVTDPESGANANSRRTPAEEEREDVEEEEAGEVPIGGTKGPSTAEADQKQQGTTETTAEDVTTTSTTGMPDTTASANASAGAVAGPPAHPEWLRTLFFTVICTGIGFFLLMLLAGLITRCEQPNDAENGIGDQHQQQNRGDRVQPTSSHSPNPNASGGAASSSAAAIEAVTTAQRRGELAIVRHTPAEHHRSMALGDLVRVPPRTGGDAADASGRGHAEPVLVVKPAAYL